MANINPTRVAVCWAVLLAFGCSSVYAFTFQYDFRDGRVILSKAKAAEAVLRKANIVKAINNSIETVFLLLKDKLVASNGHCRLKQKAVLFCGIANSCNQGDGGPTIAVRVDKMSFSERGGRVAFRICVNYPVTTEKEKNQEADSANGVCRDFTIEKITFTTVGITRRAAYKITKEVQEFLLKTFSSKVDGLQLSSDCKEYLSFELEDLINSRQ